MKPSYLKYTNTSLIIPDSHYTILKKYKSMQQQYKIDTWVNRQVYQHKIILIQDYTNTRVYQHKSILIQEYNKTRVYQYKSPQVDSCIFAEHQAVDWATKGAGAAAGPADLPAKLPGQRFVCLFDFLFWLFLSLSGRSNSCLTPKYTARTWVTLQLYRTVQYSWQDRVDRWQLLEHFSKPGFRYRIKVSSRFRG